MGVWGFLGWSRTPKPGCESRALIIHDSHPVRGCRFPCTKMSQLWVTGYGNLCQLQTMHDRSGQNTFLFKATCISEHCHEQLLLSPYDILGEVVRAGILCLYALNLPLEEANWLSQTSKTGPLQGLDALVLLHAFHKRSLSILCARNYACKESGPVPA